MTKAQILEKILLKAIDGGYDPDEIIRFWIAEGCKKDYTDGFAGHSFVGDSFEHWIDENGVEILGSIDLYTVIFSHEFAKAFWGTDINPSLIPDGLICVLGKPAWQYHLQQMVIQENPVQYLEEFL